MGGQERYLLFYILSSPECKYKIMKKERKLPFKWIVVGAIIFIINYILFKYFNN